MRVALTAATNLEGTPGPRRDGDRTPTDDPRTLAATYFRSWKEKDFVALRSVLADDATFRGPLGSADDADTCIAGMKVMAQIITDVVIHKIFVDGADVLTWFDLHTSIAPPSPTAIWSHVENGKITTIRVTFDTAPSPPKAIRDFDQQRSSLWIAPSLEVHMKKTMFDRTYALSVCSALPAAEQAALGHGRSR